MFNLFNKKAILPYLEYHIVDHCNIRCNNCLHFCDYIDEEKFINVNDIKQDLEELAKKVEIKTIRIMGGEPLLHPDIDAFLRITRDNFPNTFIVLVTNGTLLWNQNKIFWETLKEKEITVSISLYPILQDKTEEIKELFKKHDVPTYGINPTPFFHKQLNLEGNSNPKKSFKKCYSKNFINLYNHKLYQCHNCYRSYFNEKQGNNLPLPIGYDFYKMTGQEIYKKLFSKAKSSSSCKYCYEIKQASKWSCLTTDTKNTDNKINEE